jgi:cytochrome c-type biogenesis protein CcmH
VTIFIVACAVMVLAALAFIAWPLIKAARVNPPQPAVRRSYAALIVVVIVIPIAAATFYTKLGRWNWQEELAASSRSQSASTPEVEAMIAKVEQRLRDSPNDIDGWLMLGRSYMALEKSAPALGAYQKAYDLDKNNVEAAMGLGEAMIVVDERAITGKAGELFEAVLVREPNNPKALWYGAVGALSANNLPRAHERLQRMLALGPPENIRAIIERQLQDIQQQMASTGQGQPKASTPVTPGTTQSQRAIAVQVSIAPKLAANLDQKTPLFVLARDPTVPGPPLAAVRRAVGDLPVSVTITDKDAMMSGRGISNVSRVQVVARISKSGTPQAQAGDLYGEALVDLAGDKPVNVRIVIDRVVDNASAK